MLKTTWAGLLTAVLVSQLMVQPAHPVGLAVINDGDVRGDFSLVLQTFVGELETLTAGEFELEVKSLSGQWQAQGIVDALEQAYADPDIDLVLVLGLASNQLLVSRGSFDKPTFLPIVFDRQLVRAPIDGNTSGVKNLNYLTDPVDFDEDIQSMRRIFSFHQPALLVDAILLDIVKDGPIVSSRLDELGVNLVPIAHRGREDRDILSRLPEGTDAVVVTGLPRMPAPEFDDLIESMTRMGLPSFSLVGGQPSVARGFLASDAVAQDWTRLARRNALHMQSVLLGERPENLPVIFRGKRELSINLETARRIGLSPRFDVLSEAVLLNEEPPAEGPTYTLRSVTRLAVEQNLDLAAERLGLQAGYQDVRIARTARLPQLGLGGSYSQRKVSPLVEAGQFPERSLDGAISLSQALYVDDIWAGIAIQEYLYLGREQALEQVRLDIIQAASVAFLNVLRSETQLRVQQDNLKVTRTNLDLARDRVQVGTATAADIYRWETRMASTRSDLLAARSGLVQAREALNRLLHRPLTERFQLEAPVYSDPFAMNADDYDRLIDNPRQWQTLLEFYTSQGLERSPELKEVKALVATKKREVENARRAIWLPDFSLQGQYSDNLEQSGAGVGILENEDDWTLTVQGSIPIFDGGSRRSELSRARLELEQLETVLAATEERVAQNIRAALHQANASFSDIELAQQAAEASRKSLDLVTDAYASGIENVVNLLDAQNAALGAEEAADNAVYDFLIDVMAGMRAMGQFEFTLSDERQQIEAEKMRNFFAERESNR